MRSLLLVVVSLPAVASYSSELYNQQKIGFGACSDHFVGGFVPSYKDSSEKPKETLELCSSRDYFYATLYDVDFSVPAWSAYVAQPFRPGGERSDHWRQDDAPELEGTNQQPAESAHWPKDYDRGHVAPNAALYTSDAGADSTFLTTNIAAQHYKFNRYPWKNRETDIRDRADAIESPVYVIAGVGFDDRSNPNTMPGKRALSSTGENYTFHARSELLLWRCLRSGCEGKCRFLGCEQWERGGG